MSNKLFKGIMPALITPFDENGAYKRETATALIERELKTGIQGFYVNGATGEGLYLPEKTRMEHAENAVELCKGRGVVINHVGAIDCASAMRLARHAGTIGCDAISSLVPNYVNTYSDAEILDYYKALADASGKPVLVYCTGLLSGDPVAFIEKAIKIDGVIGLKYTMPNYYNMHRICCLNGGDINVINGPDETLLLGLTMGADGGIGSTYNIMGERFVSLYASFTSGDFEAARQEQFGIDRVITVLLKYGVIGAIKEVFNILGYDAGSAAAPAAKYTPEKRNALISDLEAAGFTF